MNYIRHLNRGFELFTKGFQAQSHAYQIYIALFQTVRTSTVLQESFYVTGEEGCVCKSWFQRGNLFIAV